MSPNPILVIGSSGKTGGYVDNALGHVESDALFQDPSDGRTAV